MGLIKQIAIHKQIARQNTLNLQLSNSKCVIEGSGVMLFIQEYTLVTLMPQTALCHSQRAMKKNSESEHKYRTLA